MSKATSFPESFYEPGRLSPKYHSSGSLNITSSQKQASFPIFILGPPCCQLLMAHCHVPRYSGWLDFLEVFIAGFLEHFPDSSASLLPASDHHETYFAICNLPLPSCVTRQSSLIHHHWQETFCKCLLCISQSISKRTYLLGFLKCLNNLIHNK